MPASILRSARIGTKVAIAMVLVVGVLFATYVTVTSLSLRHDAEAEAMLNVSERSMLLRTTVEVLDKSLRDQVSTYAKVFKKSLDGAFTMHPDQLVDVAGKKVPVLNLGSTVVNLDFAIPDEFTALTGGYATIFVRNGDDFVRITTSHKKEDGTRAIGTSLDHAHPAYQLLLNKETYAGSASLFGGQYMTHYQPILDSSNKVIGALYVGINFTDSMRLLGAGIKTIKLGQSGGFYVLSTRPGKDMGKALVHGKREGENLIATRDSSGRSYVQEMMTQGQGVLRYLEAVPEGNSSRERIAAFATIKDWQLLIVGDAYLDEITATATRQRNQGTVMGLILLVVVTGLLLVIIRKLVAAPFSAALAAVETVGRGDLTGRVQVKSLDESGKLLTSLQTMTEHLSKVVSEVRHGTDAITSISTEVAVGNLELSARTEQQASALEETASSMEQMNASVRQNAENAVNAQRLARDATSTARQGGEAVAQVVDKMEAIKASAERIADITSVVDSIAFQTNILALNAAVEAARAGEHGRGFAVVATEVRTLAHRSSAAAKEIKELIGESLQHVSNGSDLASRAGSTMGSVVDAIARASTTIDEISSATQEQSVGIDQINRAVVQLDEVTQQNAALVEEAAAAAQTMQAQSKHLGELVAFFVVQRPGGATEPSPASSKNQTKQVRRIA